jgi:signal peptidase II
MAIYIGIFVLLADILSKFLTATYLPLMQFSPPSYPYGGVGIFKNFFGIEFSLSHQINFGAAWGVLAEYQMPLHYLRLVFIMGLIVYAIFYNKQPRFTIPLALIISGAIGNVLDYFFYGHVIDMLHFVLWGYDFPVFNVADSCIFLGIASLCFLNYNDSKSDTQITRNI